MFAIGCSENDYKQNQSYAAEPNAAEPKPATKQKQKHALQRCLDHPENGVYATLELVQFGIVRGTAGCVLVSKSSKGIMMQKAVAAAAAELLPLPVVNDHQGKKGRQS